MFWIWGGFLLVKLITLQVAGRYKNAVKQKRP